MNNPFATVPTPAQPMQPNPFAPQAPVQQHTPPSFPMTPTTAPTANPFAAVVPAASAAPAPPPAPPTQGVAAIQTAFAFPPLNPPGEAGLGLQPLAAKNEAEVQANVDAALLRGDAQGAVTAAYQPVAPEPAPKARRSRKPRTQNEQTALDQQALATGGPAPAYEVDAAGYSPANEDAMRYGASPTIDSATTEELRDALNSRGWNVTLVAS